MIRPFDPHETFFLKLLDHPIALATLIFYWLKNGDDNAYIQFILPILGIHALPSRWTLIENSSAHDLMENIPPMFVAGTASTYHDEYVQPALEFAWAHGYLEEVYKCQSALRAAGLERYCIDSKP